MEDGEAEGRVGAERRRTDEVRRTGFIAISHLATTAEPAGTSTHHTTYNSVSQSTFRSVRWP